MYTVPRKFFTTKVVNHTQRKADITKPAVQCQYCRAHFFDKLALKQHKDRCEPRRQWWLRYSEELPGRL